MDEKRTNLTEGSVGKAALRFSLPFLLSYFLQSLYGMADLYVIGLYCGTDSTTAVSVGSQVMHVLTVLLVGLAMGTTVTTARAVGEKNPAETARAVGNSVTLFAGVSAVLTVVLLFLTRQVTALMATPPEAAGECAAYLTVCFAGIPFITAYNIIAAVYRATGDTVSPLYFVALACVSNIGLDFLFAGFFGLGPAGCALGTVLAQTLSVFASLVHAKRTGVVRLTARDLVPDRRVLGTILRIGLPVMVQDGLIQITFIVITVFANRRGLDDAAAVGIVEKMIGIFFLIPSTMLSTVSALGAMNFGASNAERARKTLRFALALAVGWGLLLSVLTQFAAERMVALFTDSERVAFLGASYLKSYVWDCVLAGVHFCFSGYFCALGKSLIPFVHNLLSMLCVRVPVAYWAAVTFADTLFPMGLASDCGSALSILICAAVYCFMRKRENSAGNRATA